MSREVRRVPKDWQHPKYGDSYIPLHGDCFSQAVAEWREAARQWGLGLVSDYKGGWEPKAARQTYSYEEYAGPCPTQYETFPDWKPEERTHLQMYETCTEGTPISPVMDTPENLARWLADNGASAFGDSTATYEAWLATIKRGYSVGAVILPSREIVSGVEWNEGKS